MDNLLREISEEDLELYDGGSGFSSAQCAYFIANCISGVGERRGCGSQQVDCMLARQCRQDQSPPYGGSRPA
ncbi:hypothetical protein JCM19047_2391 [Bacillus sp. JCM 19047]|nr:hypothetical protein JCM19047_2391 [Bacillus sp. JCM 19047]